MKTIFKFYYINYYRRKQDKNNKLSINEILLQQSFKYLKNSFPDFGADDETESNLNFDNKLVKQFKDVMLEKIIEDFQNIKNNKYV